MFEEYERPMTEEERTYLASQITEIKPTIPARTTLKWVSVWSAGLALCVLLAVGVFSLEFHPLFFIPCIVIAVAAFICLFAVNAVISGHMNWRRSVRHFSKNLVPKIRDALDNGRVTVKKVTASSVIEIVEYEDEGPGYLYDVGDGKVLVLQGQCYLPIEEKMPWPCTAFEIVRTIAGELWVGIYCSGEKLVPTRRIDMNDCDPDFAWSGREDVLDGTPESFLKTILRVECAKCGFDLRNLTEARCPECGTPFDRAWVVESEQARGE